MLIPLLFIIPFINRGGEEPLVWNLELKDLRQALETGNHQVLNNLELIEKEYAEALLIGPEAPFYIGEIFGVFEEPDKRNAFLEIAGEMSPEPWSSRAYSILISQSLSEKDYTSAEYYSLKAVKKHPGMPEFLRGLIEALYWQERDREVLEQISLFYGQVPVKTDWEISLFESVSSFREGKSQWADLFSRIILECPDIDLAVRGFLFFRNREEYTRLISESLRSLLLSRYLLASGNYPSALTGYRSFQYIKYPHLVSETARAFAGAGKASEGGAYLISLLDKTEQSLSIVLLSEAGFLFRRAARYAEAQEAFNKAWEKSEDPGYRDRIAWYALDCAMKTSVSEGEKALLFWQEKWTDPDYFSDLTGAFAERLLRERNWKTLERVYLEGQNYFSPAVTSKYRFFLARIYSSGYLPVPDPETPETLLRLTAKEKAAPYYSVLSSVILGDSVNPGDFYIWDIPEKAGRGISLLEADTPPSMLPTIASEYLKYSLPLKAYEEALGAVRDYEAEILIKISEQCYSRGHYYESLRLITRGVNAGVVKPGVKDLSLLYPSAFSEEISMAAEKEGLPVYLFTALVREESFFSPTIVSRVGAVGLCQLMPGTARDVAVKLRRSSYSMEDVSDNLAFGAYYLADQIKRFGGVIPGLWAYNAGPSRARDWLRQWEGFDPYLMPEIVPFTETRNYVKKIFLSGLYFEFLYAPSDNREGPESIINLFFPGESP